jgi:hypothetical protein
MRGSGGGVDEGGGRIHLRREVGKLSERVGVPERDVDNTVVGGCAERREDGAL